MRESRVYIVYLVLNNNLSVLIYVHPWFFYKSVGTTNPTSAFAWMYTTGNILLRLTPFRFVLS